MVVSLELSKSTGLVLAIAGLVMLPAATDAQSAGDRGVVEFRRALIGGGPAIGVTARDLTDAEIRRQGLADPGGVYVESVRADGPAASAGLTVGDILLAFDGERVRSVRQLSRLVQETPDGREVNVSVERGDGRVTLRIVPADNMPAYAYLPPRSLSTVPGASGRGVANVPGFDLTMPVPMPGIRAGTARLGVAVQSLSDQLAEHFGVGGGVLVAEVVGGTPAEAAGLEAGDVITEVDGAAVADPADLQRRVSQITGEVAITIVRNGAEQTLIVDLGNVRPPARSVM